MAIATFGSRCDMEHKGYLGVAKTAGTVRLTRDFPIATYSLVALNLILFFGSMPGDRIDLANRYGLIPDHFGEPLRFFTTIFLHFDPAHLATNVIFLWLFGRKVEKVMGSLVFLLFYIGSGFIASLLHVAVALAFLPLPLQRAPVVGASGAVAGVLGMYAIRFSREKITIGRLELSAIYLLLAWLFIQAAFGIAGILSPAGRLGPIDLSNIGYWSHIGGFVFGMTAAWVTTVRENDEGRRSSTMRLDDLRRKTLLEVAERFEALRTADPCDPFVHAELSRVWALLRDQGRSLEGYLKAVEFYRKDGMRDEALASIREALRFWPQTMLPQDAAFRFACYLEVLGEPEEAACLFAWLANAAQGKSEGEMALLKIAQIELDRLGSPDRAIEAVERLIRDYPDSRWMDVANQILSRARSGEGH